VSEAEKPHICYKGDTMIPTRGTEHAAGWDLYSMESLVLRPYQAVKVSTGIKCALPAGSVLFVLPRSGFSVHNQILMPNSVGVIDEDYRGLVMITLLWTPDPLKVIAGNINLQDLRHAQNYLAGQERPLKEDREFPVTLNWSKDAVFVVGKFERIAQCLLLPYLEQDWRKVDELPDTGRGEGGFGHTGLGAHNPKP